MIRSEIDENMDIITGIISKITEKLTRSFRVFQKKNNIKNKRAGNVYHNETKALEIYYRDM